jgi:hypothetical protein
VLFCWKCREKLPTRTSGAVTRALTRGIGQLRSALPFRSCSGHILVGAAVAPCSVRTHIGAHICYPTGRLPAHAAGGIRVRDPFVGLVPPVWRFCASHRDARAVTLYRRAWYGLNGFRSCGLWADWHRGVRRPLRWKGGRRHGRRTGYDRRRAGAWACSG